MPRTSDAIRLLTDRLEQAGNTAPHFHGTSRPIVVEREAIHRAISLAELIDVPIVIVHVSNRAAMEEIQRAQMRGLKIKGETCPQYLVLTEDDMKAWAWRAQSMSARRRRATAKPGGMLGRLAAGDLHLFSSDHCPVSLPG